VIYAENELEHDKTLQLVIDRAREKNVKFNINKFQYKVHEFKFLRMIFSEKCMFLNKEHVKSILELNNPKSKKELLTILGMFNYLSKLFLIIQC